MVGREEELERLQKFLYARGERHVVYYWAYGGLGKTRLLEELQRMVKEAGPGFHSTGIIDLYHTDTHSSSDVERAMVDGLDPDQKFFGNYRRAREKFELLRERGSDPGVLERYREDLSKHFIQDCREMALDVHKLVICFDTVELLQYESSVVEEKVGSGTVDTRIRTWLLDKLAPLANVLVIFAGRPKGQSHGETTDHQERLVADMEQAFKKSLTVVELRPFTLSEVQDFIEVLTNGETIIPAVTLPIVHRLTGGRPIFIHLVVDLVQVLTLELNRVLALFDRYADLAEAPEDRERLKEAQHQVEVEILRAFINEGGETGQYLLRLALMPKGFDSEILQRSLGLPPREADQLLADLEPLSFVKHFKASPGAERLHGERTFLHDEMYRLLTNPEVIPRLRLNERTVANALVSTYYEPHITQLEDDISHQRAPAERIPLRERLQKLQVEQLYYVLVQDARQGYEEYKRLSNQASRRRWVGFSMRLLDEFLRFYNPPERRELFEAAGISHEQVIRESAQMWVERFYWWGQRKRVVQFAHYILKHPDIFYVRPEKDEAILGNICGRWTDAQADLYGYTPSVVKEAQAILDRLPEPVDSTSEQTLARARLATSIGYQLRRGGQLALAATYYVVANAAFRKSAGYRDELVILLNNLSFAYAKQGRMELARPMAHEALRINERIGSEYSTGLTLSTLANIARMRGNYGQAIEYGQEALAIFRELEDAHGTVLAYLSITSAKRQMAKHDLEKGRKLDETHQRLKEAQGFLEKALQVAKGANLESDILDLYAEQGRVYRELGHLVSQLESIEKGLVYYRQSENYLNRFLKSKGGAKIDRADTLQDLAEVLFASSDPSAAQRHLAQVEALIGPEYQIIPGKQVPAKELSHEYFAPLGKVEVLRGHMAFAQGHLEEGLQHYIIGYAYFMRFSPDALEKITMVEPVYNRMLSLPINDQRNLMESIRGWLTQHGDPDMKVANFVQNVGDLLGV
jgi:tetratricopeptide (TPR) repeat protein